MPADALAADDAGERFRTEGGAEILDLGVGAGGAEAAPPPQQQPEAGTADERDGDNAGAALERQEPRAVRTPPRPPTRDGDAQPTLAAAAARVVTKKPAARFSAFVMQKGAVAATGDAAAHRSEAEDRRHAADAAEGEAGAGGARGDVRRSTRRRKRCLLYTSPSPRDGLLSRMPSSA